MNRKKRKPWEEESFDFEVVVESLVDGLQEH